MSNMSYCRFQNTASDLNDCADALEALFAYDEDAEALSAEELRAAKRLVERCFDIVQLVADNSEYELDELIDRVDRDKIIGDVIADASSDIAVRAAEE